MPTATNELELDAPDKSETGFEAMMAHLFRLLRNMSLVAELQVNLAKAALPTLMKISNFMTEYLAMVDEPTSTQHDIVNDCSATMFNLSSHPENRTRFYKLELSESLVSECEIAIENKKTQRRGSAPPSRPQSSSMPPKHPLQNLGAVRNSLCRPWVVSCPCSLAVAVDTNSKGIT